MRTKHRANTAPGSAVEPWSRQRLQAVLAAIVIVALVLIAGLGYAAVRIVASATPEEEPVAADLAADYEVGEAGVRGQEYRDAVAAAPMLEITEADLRPAPPSLEQAEPLMVPGATDTGPSDVPTGYPHTPEGAVGQLAAIVTTALPTMDTNTARFVFNAWSDADFTAWPIAEAIQAFHASAGTTDGDPLLETSSVPVAGQVKGTDGDDWALACVLFDVRISLATETRFGFGHCERMQWDGTRWEIAPGPPPATAPSTWPASERSLDAGWRPLEPKD